MTKPTLLKHFRRTIAVFLISIISSLGALAQITVKGSVLNKEKEPLIGATIMEKGTTNGTTADIDCNFTLVVKGNDSKLEFSYVG